VLVERAGLLAAAGRGDEAQAARQEAATRAAALAVGDCHSALDDLPVPAGTQEA